MHQERENQWLLKIVLKTHCKFLYLVNYPAPGLSYNAQGHRASLLPIPTPQIFEKADLLPTDNVLKRKKKVKDYKLAEIFQKICCIIIVTLLFVTLATYYNKILAKYYKILARICSTNFYKLYI